MYCHVSITIPTCIVMDVCIYIRTLYNYVHTDLQNLASLVPRPIPSFTLKNVDKIGGTRLESSNLPFPPPPHT